MRNCFVKTILTFKIIVHRGEKRNEIDFYQLITNQQSKWLGKFVRLWM